MFNFEKLETWQKAIGFADLVDCSEADFQRLYVAAEEQGKMLSGLRRSILEG